MRMIDRPTDGTAPLLETRSLNSRIPGVCPVVLQKSTKYPPAIRIQASPISMPTSHCGRRPPTSEATSATTATSNR